MNGWWLLRHGFYVEVDGDCVPNFDRFAVLLTGGEVGQQLDNADYFGVAILIYAFQNLYLLHSQIQKSLFLLYILLSQKEYFVNFLENVHNLS